MYDEQICRNNYVLRFPMSGCSNSWIYNFESIELKITQVDIVVINCVNKV